MLRFGEESAAADTLWIRLVDAGVKETVIRRLEALGLAVIDNESRNEAGGRKWLGYTACFSRSEFPRAA